MHSSYEQLWLTYMLLAGVHTPCLLILLHPHSDGPEVNIHSTYLILLTPEGNIYVLINPVVISYSSAFSALSSPFPPLEPAALPPP